MTGTAAKPPLRLAAIFPELDEIRDAALRRAVVAVWDRLWAMSEYERLEDVPVSVKITYPHIRHAQAIVKVALAAARIWEEVHGTTFDRDHLIAGALLMDVSKLVETRRRPDGGDEATDIGKAVPHAWYAAHLALELGVPLPVVHIITVHSPNSGKAPATREAMLLDRIDQADINAFGWDIWTRRVIHYQP